MDEDEYPVGEYPPIECFAGLFDKRRYIEIVDMAGVVIRRIRDRLSEGFN